MGYYLKDSPEHWFLYDFAEIWQKKGVSFGDIDLELLQDLSASYAGMF